MPANLIQCFTANVVSISSTNNTPSRVWSAFDWRSEDYALPVCHTAWKPSTLCEASSNLLRSVVYASSLIILSLVPRKSLPQTLSILCNMCLFIGSCLFEAQTSRSWARINHAKLSAARLKILSRPTRYMRRIANQLIRWLQALIHSLSSPCSVSRSWAQVHRSCYQHINNANMPPTTAARLISARACIVS